MVITCGQLIYVWEAAYYMENEIGVFAKRVTLTPVVWETEVSHDGRVCSLKMTCL
jgi:hypothetical protein